MPSVLGACTGCTSYQPDRVARSFAEPIAGSGSGLRVQSTGYIVSDIAAFGRPMTFGIWTVDLWWPTVRAWALSLLRFSHGGAHEIYRRHYASHRGPRRDRRGALFDGMGRQPSGVELGRWWRADFRRASHP